jgi:hypothetical protein
VKLFGRDLSGFAKTLVVLVAVLLVSSGLCGLQLLFGNEIYRSASGLLILTGVLELAAFVLSAAGIVLMLILWVARVLYRLGQKRTDEGS